MSKLKNLVGNRYTRWLVLEYIGCTNRQYNLHKWLCKCDCGTVREVDGGSLKSGNSTSCGCLKVEKFKERVTTHGMTNSKIWNSYRGMKERCTNKNNKRYESYGGRGISYDPKWETFEGFLEDMLPTYQEGLELDRIDVNGNYCKENCRWSTQSEQCYNQRLRTDNKSGKSGVWWEERSGKWLAYIRVNNKKIRLGLFTFKDDAIAARIEAELKYYGYTRP